MKCDVLENDTFQSTTLVSLNTQQSIQPEQSATNEDAECSAENTTAAKLPDEVENGY